MNYGRVHRFLLRTIASRGVLSIPETEEIVTKYADNNEVSIENLVREINEKIRPLNQEIKISNDELTDEQVIVFICLGHDEATKSQNVFSATELEYFRLLLEEIMSIESRQITGILALNLVNRLQISSFTKSHGKKLLDTWCRMRYLDKDENNYALGVRANHEFPMYLRQSMPDTIEECFLCKKIVFRGYNCPACAQAVHTRCLNNYLEKVQKWPCCKADFNQHQLEKLKSASESSRLTQTQVLDETSQQSAEYNTIVGNSQDLSQDVEMTRDLFPDISQDLMPEISQELLQELSQEVLPEVTRRVTRKRKRN